LENNTLCCDSFGKENAVAQQIKKHLVVPQDGSPHAIDALNYLGRFYTPSMALKIQLVYVLPQLPQIMVEEGQRNRETARLLKKMSGKHEETARRALEDSRLHLSSLGFSEDQIITTIHRLAPGVARGICDLAETQTADAIVMSSRGQGRLETFFLGATATKVADASAVCPVWLVKGEVHHPKVLIALDLSESAQRALDHAGFMLAQVDHPVILFYSRRNFLRFFPREVVDAAPGIEAVWESRAGEEIAPVMERAKMALIAAGVAEDRISVKVVEGSRNAGADILKTIKKEGCGTLIIGRHGEAGHKSFPMGSVVRNVVQESRDLAMWIIP
jgi:nucleotide-binding universal stress UspA family protein